MREKKVLITIGNVRIKEYDRMSVVIERYEDVFIPKDKQTVKKWRFKGYSNTISNALKFIQSKELLIDRKAVSDLESYLKQVEEANAALLEVIRG